MWGVSCVPVLTPFSTDMLLSMDFHNQMGPSSHCEHQFGVYSDKSPPASSSGVHWFCKSEWCPERVFCCVGLPLNLNAG